MRAASAAVDDLIVGVAQLVVVVAKAGHQRGGRRQFPGRAAVDIVGRSIRRDVHIERRPHEIARIDLVDGRVRVEESRDEADRLIRGRDELQFLALLHNGFVLQLRVVECMRVAGHGSEWRPAHKGVEEVGCGGKNILNLLLAFVLVRAGRSERIAAAQIEIEVQLAVIVILLMPRRVHGTGVSQILPTRRIGQEQ